MNLLNKYKLKNKGLKFSCWKYGLDELLTEFAKEYHKEQLKLNGVMRQSEQLRFLIDKFQTPKGNYIIELLLEFNKNQP